MKRFCLFLLCLTIINNIKQHIIKTTNKMNNEQHDCKTKTNKTDTTKHKENNTLQKHNKYIKTLQQKNNTHHKYKQT